MSRRSSFATVAAGSVGGAAAPSADDAEDRLVDRRVDTEQTVERDPEEEQGGRGGREPGAGEPPGPGGEQGGPGEREGHVDNREVEEPQGVRALALLSEDPAVLAKVERHHAFNRDCKLTREDLFGTAEAPPRTRLARSGDV